MPTLASVSHSEAVLYVQRVGPMADFYAGALGLEPRERGDDFCALRSPGWTLWLVVGTGSARVDGDGEVRRRSEVPIKLCFVVARLDAARVRIGELGGRCQNGEWEFGGYRRTDAVDPEGNVVQLLEAVSADAPAD
jgi:predicted enzyme related to lactoylglutathione lyase